MPKTYVFSKPSGVLIEEEVSPGVKRPIAVSDTASAYFQGDDLCINIGANCILAIKTGDSVKIGATTHTTLDAAAVGLAGLFKKGGSTGEGVQATPVAEVWTRPTEWLPIPSYTESEQVFYGLHAVWDTTVNPCAFSAGGTGAGITVDWGDGTITDYEFGVTIERNFNYSSLTGTPFRAYRQSLVKITPRAGATINALYLATRHSAYPYQYHTGWLDCHLNFTVTNTLPFNWNIPVLHSNIENIFIKAYTSTRMDGMFMNMYALQKVNAFNTSAVTLAQSCYSGCSSLKEDPNFDFSNVTNANTMYAGTTNLIKIKPTDFRKVTDAGYMFNGTGLKDISALQFRDITNMFFFSYGSVGITHWCDFSNCNNIVGSIDYSITSRGSDIFPNIKLGGITNMTNIMYANETRSIRKFLNTGARYSHTIANQLLDATALNEYFTGLGTAISGAALTITGNPGAGSCTTSIATSKGWTIIN